MSTDDNGPAQDFANWLGPRLPGATAEVAANPKAGETRPGPITDDPRQPDEDFAAWLTQHVN